jgi:DNA-binding winged helix-turn-helix (wHTH) protein
LISDDLRCTPRQQRCLDMLERANARVVPEVIMMDAMYPPPADRPTKFNNLLRVTICQLRKILAAGGSSLCIQNLRGRGYRLLWPSPQSLVN